MSLSHLTRQSVSFLAGGVTVIALAAGGAALALNSPETPDSRAEVIEPAGTPEATYLVECVEGNLVQEPSTFTVACADANSSLDQLAWAGWGAASASATGVLSVNACEPDCASSREWETYPLTLTASGLELGEASALYTKLTLDFAGETPPGYSDGETVELIGSRD